MYPIDKYRYYTAKTATGSRKIIAVSTYAGKTVRGVAICHPEDTFDIEKGKEIAAARCALKVAMKRLGRARKAYRDTNDKLDQLYNKVEKMRQYYSDAANAVYGAEDHLNDLLDALG